MPEVTYIVTVNHAGVKDPWLADLAYELEKRATEFLGRNAVNHVTVTKAETEYGRNFEGMAGEILPTGTAKPKRMREYFKRSVSQWVALTDRDFYSPEEAPAKLTTVPVRRREDGVVWSNESS